MNSLNISLWREKTSRRGFNWSFLAILSAVLIISGFFVLTPVLAEHTATVTVNPLYVQGNHTDTYAFTVINNGTDSIYKIVITADSDFTINGDPTCPNNWESSHTGTTAQCMADPFSPDILPTEGNTQISFSATSPNPESDTLYTWTVSTRDSNGGYESSNINAQTLVDINDPITTATAPEGWQIEKPISISLTCDDVDGSGCADIYYTTNGTDPTTGSPVYLDPISISTEGSTEIRYFAVDNAGNIETPIKSVTVQIDTLAPVTTDSADSNWHNSDVTVTLTATDAISDVAATYYTTDGTEPTTASTLYLLPFPLTVEGEYQLKYFSVDNAGNTELVVIGDMVKIDKTDPITTIAITPLIPDGANSWYKTTPTIALSCTDQAELSGCDTIYYRWGDSGEYSIDNESLEIPEGENTLYYYSEDIAGNEEIAQTFPLKVDTEEPKIDVYDITDSVFSPNDDAVKDTTTIDLKFSESVDYLIEIKDSLNTTVKSWSGTATDPDSKTWPEASDETPADGIYTIVITLTDPAGNQVIDTSETLTIDTVKPDVTLSYVQGEHSDGYFKAGALTITANFTEEIVTVPTISINQQGSVDVNNDVIAGSVTDWSYVYAIQTQDGLNYLDGIASVSLANAQDAAGNISNQPATNTTFNIDTIEPNVTINSPIDDGVIKNDFIALISSASDVSSSVSCQYQIDSGESNPIDCTGGEITGLTDGRHTLILIATDTAGNSNSASISFVIDLDNTLTVGAAGADFTSIQMAIDAATAGNTISVLAGEYTEDLSIEKAVELAGADKNTTVIKGIANVVATSWPLADPNIEILASGVKIHGFTIEGPNYVANYYASGMVIDGTNIEIYDNNFVTTPAANTNELAHAITTYSKAVIPTADISGLNIHNNIFIGAGTLGCEAIYINPHTGTGIITINNNEFSGAIYVGITAESGNIGVVNNQIDNNIVGKGLYGIRFMDTTYSGNYDNIVVSGNNIQNTQKGVRVGNGGEGASLFTADISSNTLTNNDIGIWARNGSVLTVANNSLAGNTIGIQNDIATNVNAIHNWWGTAVKLTIQANIVGEVTFEPYCIDEEMMILSSDAPAYVYVDGAYIDGDAEGHTFGYDAFATIQEGIEAVDIGGTVDIAAGTYTETITIGNKSGLTITGDSVSRPIVNGGVKFENTDDISSITLENLYFKGDAGSNQIFKNANTAAINGFLMDKSVLDGEMVDDRDGIAGNLFGQSFIVTNTEFKNIYGFAVMDIDSSSDYSPYGGNGLEMTTITFTGNNIHDCDGSVAIRGHYPNKTATVNVHGNTWNNIGGNIPATDDHWAAVEINHAQVLNLYENTINGVTLGIGGEGQAIQLWDIDTLDFHDNTITNNAQGIFVFGGLSGGSYGGPWAIPGGSIYKNTISGNTEYDIKVESTATGNNLNVKENWWGVAVPDFALIILGNVDYDPWYLDSGMNMLSSDIGQDVIYVDDNYTSIETCESDNHYYQFNCFETIQEGINTVTENGLVEVGPGVYEEIITINKPLTLRGATYDVNKNGYAVPGNYAWNTEVESIINHPDSAGGYISIVDIIDVDNVTFEGFVVQELNAIANLNSSLIRVYAHTREISNIVVRNNIIGPNTNVVSQDGTHGRMGLYIVNHPYSDKGVVNSAFSGNKIFDTKGNGNNIFLWSSYYSYGALGPASMSGTVIEDNEIYGSHRSGIETAGGFSDLTIRGNSIYENSGRPGDTPDLKYGNGIVMIRGSGDRSTCDGYGPVNVTIETNEIYDNEDHGIYMGPNNQGIVITNNDIYNNGSDAVRVDLIGNYWNPDFETNPGPYTCLDGSNNVSLDSNKIYGNGGGVQVIGTPNNDFEVAAEFNWWDTTTGPYYESNAGGLGDEVSDNVDFRPWCIEENCITQDDEIPSMISNSQTPPDGAVGVSLLPAVSVEFDTVVQCGAGSDWSDCFSIDSATGSFDYPDNTLTFTPDSNLDYNTEYTVNLTDIIDVAGNLLSDIGDWDFITLTSYSISLESGMNLVSIPTVPSVGTDISNVLGDAEQYINTVWQYDADATEGEEWKVYHVGGEENTSNLFVIEPGYGYWVDAEVDTTISGEGSLFGSQGTPNTSMPSVDLFNSWNLIGYYQRAGDTISSINSALSSLGDKWDSLITYENGSSVPLDSDSEISPGKAFWAFLTEDTPYAPGDKYTQ